MINLYAIGCYNTEDFEKNNKFYTLFLNDCGEWEPIANAELLDEPIAILFSKARSSHYVTDILIPLRHIGADFILIQGDGLIGQAKESLQEISQEEGWEYYTTEEFLAKYCTTKSK